jgi:hypothetical protein
VKEVDVIRKELSGEGGGVGSEPLLLKTGLLVSHSLKFFGCLILKRVQVEGGGREG